MVYLVKESSQKLMEKTSEIAAMGGIKQTNNFFICPLWDYKNRVSCLLLGVKNEISCPF